MSTTTNESKAVSERVISVDAGAVKGPRVTHFRRTIGAGRVGEGRYADWQDQLRMCKEELGFEYMRCHGLLHDELGVYREDKEGKPVYNFQYIDLVFDFLLKIGVRPFVEFGFMPNDLASIRTEKRGPDGQMDDPRHPGQKRRVTVFEWWANVTPPKDTQKWSDLITALTKHWTERYGAEEVTKWLFEVWNEPNHKGFWSPEDETKRAEEYFELYALTAKAVKSVNPDYRIGGPATAGPAYIAELIEYCEKRNVPIDLITYHVYGLVGGPGGLDEFGDYLCYLNPIPRGLATWANTQRPVIEETNKPGLPIHITEWSTSFSPRDPIHDDYFSAPYILEQLKHTEEIASMAYWTFTDLFEETGIPPRPFHGGFGLVTVQGIKKPSYYAYRFLQRLGEEELVNGDEQSWVCRSKSGAVQALFWDLTMPEVKDVPNQTLFRKIRPASVTQTVKFAISGLRPGRYRLSVYGVGYEKNDAYTAYLKMGAPTTLLPRQVEQLKSITTDAPEREEDVVVGTAGKWEQSFPLRNQDVVLVELTRIYG